MSLRLRGLRGRRALRVSCGEPQRCRREPAVARARRTQAVAGAGPVPAVAVRDEVTAGSCLRCERALCWGAPHPRDSGRERARAGGGHYITAGPAAGLQLDQPVGGAPAHSLDWRSP